MKNIVIDTSTFIRAFLEFDDTAKKMFALLPKLKYRIVMTEEMSKELLIATSDVLAKRKIEPRKYLRVIAVFLLYAYPVKKTSEFPWCYDPDDAMFIECAIDSNAKYVISNDRSLTTLKEYVTDKKALEMIKDIEFLTPKEFLKLHSY